MKLRIKEFADLTGVSVRTLHYYGEIGLLVPAYVDRHTGYRFYDENSLSRMQEILFYRELDFPLKTIGEILSSPNYDKEAVLKEQKTLLVLKKERLERLISAIDLAVKGENVMSAFDNREFETYKAEAAQKWGNTDTYKEHSKKTADYSQDKWQALTDGMNAIFGEFAQCMKHGASPWAEEAQSLVKKLQNYITEHYYTCTTAIFAGLGQMYILDDRFKQNIDTHGQGTAAFVSSAIEAYCNNH